MSTKKPVLVDEQTGEVTGGNLTKNNVASSDPTVTLDQ